MIFACKNINKAFVTGPVLTNVSFHVNEREKVAVVGVNGAGKSTLLKIIMGNETADSGEVIFSKGATVGYLAQHQEMSTDHTIFDVMLEVKKDVILLDQKLRALEQAMKHTDGEELEQMLRSYTLLDHEFEMKNGYAYRSEITGVLKGLGFAEDEFDKKVSTLSGGQKTRVYLGKILLSTPDIIFLDEPTNHLDMESIAWLENFLLNYNGSVVIVAHDRYFLDKVVSKVVELEQTKSEMYLGNYTQFARKKAAERETVLKHYLNQQREIKHQEDVIAKLRSFNREKSVRRAESREKLLEKVDRIEKPVMNEAGIHFALEPHTMSGNDVLTVRGLAKAYQEQLFTGLDFDIKRGERVAIIGNNGSGKTTILKIINGIINADAGEIKPGAKVRIGYYDQEHQILDPEKTLFEELQDAYPHLDNTRVRNILAAFLFTNEDVFKRVRDISGGERGRISLAKLMLSEANFLILDEPTNHLDIMSKEILENALNSYTGTILYVSHDRYFINKTATRILSLTKGTLLEYLGNYDYFLEKKQDVEQAYLGISKDGRVLFSRSGSSAPGSHSPEDTDKQRREDADGRIDWIQQKEEQAKLRKRQNDIQKTEDEINRLEARNAEIDTLSAREEIYTDGQKLMELHHEKKELELRLEELLEQWEELSGQ